MNGPGGGSLAIRWTAEWSVGDERLDEQHKELFERLNALMEAVGHRTRREQVADTIAFLEVYVLRHFKDEERMMRESGYPRMDGHLAQHAAFLEAFARIKDEHARRGVTAALAADVQHQVCAWLLNHVGKTDRAFGAYLAKNRP